MIQIDKLMIGDLLNTIDGARMLKKTYGGFHKWGYSKSWMVYTGQSIYIYMDDLGHGYPMYENLHINVYAHDTH